ncbi:SCO2322 family protein [Mariniluteicoccus flavus]
MSVVRRLVAALLVALGAVSLVAAPAHAEDAYRYWSFWQYANGQWDYAQKGADGIVPADGSVQGWRFAASGMNEKRTPRAAADFAAICAAAPAEEGKKRVAIVLDQGTPEDAPNAATDKPNGQVQGTCVVLKPEANAAEALAMVADVRKEKGKTCGIGGYPATACTEPVRIDRPAQDQQLTMSVQAPKGSSKAAPAPAPAPDAKGGFAAVAPWLIGAVLLLALAGGAYALKRGRDRDAA